MRPVNDKPERPRKSNAIEQLQDRKRAQEHCDYKRHPRKRVDFGVKKNADCGAENGSEDKSDGRFGNARNFFDREVLGHHE